MSKYLVTGGAGFIGSHLVEKLLEQGHQVIVLDDLSTGKRENLPSEAELVVGDIVDQQVVKSCLDGVDGCYHLAAIASVEKSNKEWIQTHRVNLTGTITIFDAAKTAKQGQAIPVVYASSAAIYGDNHDLPLQERADKLPLTAYGVDKYACELHAKVATHVHAVPTIGTRFFNVYGPRQDPHSPYSGVISIFFEGIANGQQVAVNGDGEQSRDFIYVADVVKHLTASMNRLEGHHQPLAEVYNVCTKRSTTVNELAETLSIVLKQPLDKVHTDPRVGDIRQSLGDNKKAKETFGFSADVVLQDGLESMLDYIQQHELSAKKFA